jgi:uridine phosphorylase
VRADDYPILEFDPDPLALIEPAEQLEQRDLPPACVLAVQPDAIAALAGSGRAVEVHVLPTGMGPVSVYSFASQAGTVTLCNPGVGSAFAAVRTEELIALGCRAFVLCGGCGVLDSELPRGALFVAEAAVRDEGTSYHYLPPSREVAADPQALQAVRQLLDQRELVYRVAKTWTTDGVYRETRARIQRRRDEGCLTVEMEAAAVMAVCQFRRVPLAVLMHGADDVSGEAWDPREERMRDLHGERLIELAAAAALALLPEGEAR